MAISVPHGVDHILMRPNSLRHAPQLRDLQPLPHFDGKQIHQEVPYSFDPDFLRLDCDQSCGPHDEQNLDPKERFTFVKELQAFLVFIEFSL